MRHVAVVFAAVALLATPAAASSDNWWFQTPGGAAYCGIDNGWVCARPKDGFWIRLTGMYGRTPDVRKGHANRYRGHRTMAPRTLGFGQVFYSSDAHVITCWSRRTAVTCRHYEGLSFSLGRERGYRVFYDTPGIAPNVRPLFRTSNGIYCGIDRENLEPANPFLKCWRQLDGLVLGIAHDDAGRGGGHSRLEKAIGLRPRGFRLLPEGATFVWRCRQVTDLFADRCSTDEGSRVFACTSTRTRLTCTNRDGHGFWANVRSFYTF